MGPQVCASRNFLLLWQSQFVGDFGGNVSSIAVPAAVVLSMHATTMQVGALDAVSSGMIPLCAIGAGVIADRVRRKPLLLGANLVRLAALLSIPLAFAVGHLSIAWFFAVAAVVAGASSLFDTAYAAYVPHVVGEAAVADTNAKLTMGSSLAEAAGSGVAGALVMAVGAPFVIAINVLTFVYATVALAAIRIVEPQPVQRISGARPGRDVWDGIAVVLRQPALRVATLSNALAHFGGGMAAAVATVYVYRDIHLSPLGLGLVMGIANTGALAAWSAVRLADRFGVRRTLAGAHVVSAMGKAMLPLFAGMFPLVALSASRLLLTAAGPVFAVTDANLRLALVPDALRGRATATARTIVWSALPLGSLAGGALGGWIGLSTTMLYGAAFTALAGLLVVTCDARTFRGNRLSGDGHPLPWTIAMCAGAAPP
jgi:MFS family permease